MVKGLTVVYEPFVDSGEDFTVGGQRELVEVVAAAQSDLFTADAVLYMKDFAGNGQLQAGGRGLVRNIVITAIEKPKDFGVMHETSQRGSKMRIVQHTHLLTCKSN